MNGRTQPPVSGQGLNRFVCELRGAHNQRLAEYLADIRALAVSTISLWIVWVRTHKGPETKARRVEIGKAMRPSEIGCGAEVPSEPMSGRQVQAIVAAVSVRIHEVHTLEIGLRVE